MTRHLFVADRVRTGVGSTGDAVLVDDGLITRVGWWREMELDDVATTRFSGATIVPAFRDAHVHPVGLAATSTGLDLSPANSFADLQDLIREWAGGLPPHAALVGSGLDDERLIEGRMPTRHDLDRILMARPILVYRHCSHIAAANSAALARAGISDVTFDPPGGRIVRSTAGAPTGVLEETAIALVSGALADDSPGPDAAGVAEVIDGLAQRGITHLDAIVSAGSPMWCGSGNELDLLLAAHTEQRVRVFVAADTPNDLRTAARRIGESPRLRFGGWKGFADGSLGGHTALLREPYADASDTAGLDRWNAATMRAMAETALELGGRVAIHAIGDAALQRVIELAEDLRPPTGTIRAEHSSVCPPDLIDRMATAGVVASVQPQFVSSDGPWLERRLGPNRSRHAYPFASMLAAGVAVMAGSDAPIERPDPLTAMSITLERAGNQETESLDWDQALGIHAAHRLTPGDPADLVVIAPDLARSDTSILEVIREGALVGQTRRWGATSDS